MSLRGVVFLVVPAWPGLIVVVTAGVIASGLAAVRRRMWCADGSGPYVHMRVACYKASPRMWYEKHSYWSKLPL